MVTKNGRCWRLVRRVYGTLTIMAAVAIASGCYTTRWVPLTQAPPKDSTASLKVWVRSDSAYTATGKMTIYDPRMEGDSVLVGSLAPPYDTAMSRPTRVQAASTFVQVRHFDVLRTAAIPAAMVLAAGAVVDIWIMSNYGG